MKKIIIIGAPRTGTTALGTVLSLSKRILVMHELGLYDNNPQNYHNRKEYVLKFPINQRFLENKGLTEKDIEDFFNGDFKNKGDLEFFGDKWPTYCTSKEYCNHLIENHSDAYFIFTYRNPCAIIHSDIKRTKYEPKTDVSTDWYFKSLQENTDKLIEYSTNWSTRIFPYVDNKIIIDYDYYINNVNLLINDLSKFLKTDIEIPNMENTLGHTENYETGFRGLYEHPNPNEYQDNLTQDEINTILDRTEVLDRYVRYLIKKQQS